VPHQHRQRRYTTLTGKVPPGTYVGVTLSVGVPVKSADADKVSLNHSNTGHHHPEILTSSAMAWSWQAGRKFMKIEYVPDTPIARPDGTTTTTWNVHLGSTGCKGDPTKGVVTACTNPNRMDFSFAAFNASTQKIVLDLAELFKNSDLSYEGGGAAAACPAPPIRNARAPSRPCRSTWPPACPSTAAPPRRSLP
jgi:uncharacterized repeat protein (TIGR04052 family)